MKALRKVGVPYSLSQAEYDANVTKFGETVARQLHIPDAQKNLVEQANFGNYDGDRSGISEMDALVAYLQMLAPWSISANTPTTRSSTTADRNGPRA